MTQEQRPGETAAWRTVGDLLSEDMRSSLTTITGFFDLLAADDPQPAAERKARYSLYIRKQLDRINELVEAFDAVRRGFPDRYLVFFADRWVEQLRPAWLPDDDWQPQIGYEAANVRLRGDAHALRIALRLLFHYVYGSPGRSSGLRLTAEVDGDRLRLETYGIPQAADPFAQGQFEETAAGTYGRSPVAFAVSLEAIYVESALALHDGTLDWLSLPGQTSGCRITLPLFGP
ncbi:MAG: HAMP domain-containing histidine kinase [Paenibacillaceae bacterium]|nr:HAMP domain-containing histidine kinase [Paenibacillaceae bacterium]